MKGTGIQWADDTVNPTTGCDGCELWIPGHGGPCYAGNLHENRLAKSIPVLYASDFTEVRTAPGRMKKIANCMDLSGKSRPTKPWLDGAPRMIFLGDLGDVFSRGIPFEYLKEELFEIARSPQGRRHIWLCLTKQPKRACEFAEYLGEWSDNIWIGTSVTSPVTVRRVERLEKHPAAIKFVSLEPQVEDIDLTPWLSGVSWVIQGGESDQTPYQARPFHLDWARRMRDDCRRHDVAYFLKQLGSHPIENGNRLKLVDSHGGDWLEWDPDLRIREVPAGISLSTSHARR